ncbi:MAG: hypothetical protein QOK06_2180 [Acidimicrobiaceae bacterium]
MGGGRGASAKLMAAVLTAVAATSFAVSAVAPTTATAQASQVGATINQTGWWSRVNEVPASPLPGVTLPVATVPAPPTVPAGAIAVSATAGQIDKVAAVGITPEVSSGIVERATLSIPEASTGQINNTGAEAVLVACPITEFWVGGPNGSWSNQPPNSCSTAKVVGVRSPEGVWTFDLTPIAAQWLTPGALAPNGVALLPEVATGSGATFQVALASDPPSIGIDLAASPPAPRTSAATTAPTAPVTGGGGAAPITAPRPATATTAGTSTPATTPVPPPATPTTAAAPVNASQSDSILGNLPRAVIVLALLALIGAFLLMVALGPLGEPATGVTREGGVSRALAARDRAAAHIAEPNVALEAP